jgi:phenylalanyl-tRNA synthetase beta chain
MKISLDWLKDYVDVDLPLQEFVDRLTMIGLMVKETEDKNGDVVLDVETYANRPDTLGHLGIAREIAALLGKPLKEKTWPLIEMPTRTTELVDVQVQDEDLCPRYCGLVVRGVTVGPSPDWLRARIEAMGLHSINTIVDVSNFVLFATGQPIHAFDLAKIAGLHVLVRRAKKGERIRTLDDRDAALTADMLVIADDKKPIAVAGVIGGQDTAVSEATRDIFIESAAFDPVSVRKTRQALDMQTDASYRFERGADIGFAPQGAVMAASLMTRFGGKASREVIDLYPHPRKPREMMLRARRVAELLGVEIKPAFIEKILGDLGFGLKSRPIGSWMALVPSHRLDIEREADLVEDVARFYGYDKIPVIVPLLEVLEPGPSLAEKIRRLGRPLFHFGFDEVVNPSFADPEKEAALATGRLPVGIRNPISIKASVLRTTLLGSLLENIAWNRNRGLDGVHVFETGRVYSWRDAEMSVPVEDRSLALATTGPLGTVRWDDKPRETDLFHLKGAVEAALEALRYDPLAFAPEAHPLFDPGGALAVLYKGERIGVLGRIRLDLLDLYGIKGPVYAAEIGLDRLFEKKPRPFEFAALPKYPAVVRDLSFWIGREAAFQDVKQAVLKADAPGLERFDVIDRYDGDKAPQDKIGLSLRFVYRHPKGTLTAEDVDKSEQKIVKALKTALAVQFREGGSQ